MNLAKYEWKVNTTSDNSNEKIEVLQAAGLNYSPAFLRLCLNRGLETIEQIQQAVDQTPQLYHNPFELYQMDVAVERLKLAVSNQEKIVIYGDYDADGITSTLILYETLEQIGADVSYYLPNRLIDGYGPNVERYRVLIEEGAQLILTCDNGVAGHEAIDLANELGVDVIVSDHHEIQETLPNAYAVIHPKHPMGQYPFGELSGAGVALKISHALLDEIAPEAVELAAIGTLCDMVSLTDENRTIVLGGLQLVADTHRLGLRILLEDQKVDLSKVDVDTVGFVIGPRLNAIGRLGDPTPALELLKSFDESEAQQLVHLINEKNSERQAIVKDIQTQVEARLDQSDEIPDVIIEADPSWQAGVLGIVASRLKEKYNRPTILFQYLEDKQVYKGSGRSIKNVNIFEWLTQVKETIAYYGGHSQAAGLTVSADEWVAFKDALSSFATKNQELVRQPEKLMIDMIMRPAEATVKFIEEIDFLGPFGMDNAKPIFEFQDVTVQDKRLIGADKTHVKLAITGKEKDESGLNCVAFSKARQFEGIEAGSILSVVGTLALNEWRNLVNPQLMVTDIGIKQSQWLDYRSSRIDPQLLRVADALYVFRHQKLADYYKTLLPLSSRIALYNAVDEHLVTDLTEKSILDNIVIMEPPQSLSALTLLLTQKEWSQVYLGSFVQESKYTAGEPTREEFAMLYRWLSKQTPFHLRERLSKMSELLKISPTKLKLMFVVFFEAEFVTIKDGFIAFNTEHSKEAVDLLTMPAFERYREEMQVEAFLNYQTLIDIKRYFEENEKTS